MWFVRVVVRLYGCVLVVFWLWMVWLGNCLYWCLVWLFGWWLICVWLVWLLVGWWLVCVLFVWSWYCCYWVVVGLVVGFGVCWCVVFWWFGLCCLLCLWLCCVGLGLFGWCWLFLGCFWVGGCVCGIWGVSGGFDGIVWFSVMFW